MLIISKKTWNEIWRILKPNGRFVVSDIYSTEDVPEKYKSDPEAVAECWAGSITKEKYLDIIKNAKLKDIQIVEESRPYKKGEIEVSSFTVTGYNRS